MARFLVLLPFTLASALNPLTLRTAHQPCTLNVIHQRGSASTLAAAADDTPSLTDVPAFVQSLLTSGVEKDDVRAAFSEALAKAVPPAKPKATQQIDFDSPITPTTVTAAKQAFREAYAGASNVSPMKASTFKFASVLFETSVIWNAQYSRVFAVGLMALCDTFLESCLTEQDKEVTRWSICFALGLRVTQVAEDAQAMLAMAAGSSAAELLESEDLRAITQMAGSFKYTYAFGVGLAMLMRAVGDTPDDSATADRWCEALKLNCARTLERDYIRPLSIDGIGRFNFDSLGVASAASLQSIGVTGSF
mmetsp:Transcript_26761/g.53770  ORF Transcript_26761/g.53770 Transcript_26761/m.53770 type:complete len:307 (-) Transcript_26761:23-943(-)|eukprot:CAMPEP_0174700376 /NCGR_PEP_ID=MMETSP1094-20130205/5344_1 /TAXON_ID=156173 /ORGANISM="Chrysochromulina brevifilum, Strain UTEX LB 985" /LENGTH=306 /DNA_ID=CAMNT_0015897841 /DNA_START=130 /DNA_END=1050 /DNA_ORIENTATION=+